MTDFPRSKPVDSDFDSFFIACSGIKDLLSHALTAAPDHPESPLQRRPRVFRRLEEHPPSVTRKHADKVIRNGHRVSSDVP